MGLTLQPYWSPGVRIPGPEAKGAIIGWGDVHTRAHLYRAILEGLAYALREGAERTERRTGVRIRELRVSGGGSQSPAAVQLTADVFGLPTGRPHTYETSGLGAAIDAAVGLGIHPSFEAAVAAMTRVVEVRDPDPGDPRRSTTRSTATSTGGCTRRSSRSTPRSAGSPATRRRSEPRPGSGSAGLGSAGLGSALGSRPSAAGAGVAGSTPAPGVYVPWTMIDSAPGKKNPSSRSLSTRSTT